jgi:hypothetical protein
MDHNDYREKVDTEVDEQVEDEETPARAQSALRYKIAKELFDTEDAETRQRLRQENDDQHKALFAAAEQASSPTLPVGPTGMS